MPSLEGAAAPRVAAVSAPRDCAPQDHRITGSSDHGFGFASHGNGPARTVSLTDHEGADRLMALLITLARRHVGTLASWHVGMWTRLDAGTHS